MKLKNYYKSLTIKEKKKYAGKLDYSHDYVRVHLIPSGKNPDSTPPLDKLKLMASKSSGKVSFLEVVEHFASVTKRTAV